MNIRLAEEKDIDSVIKLLTQVLNIHAKIRPDIFIGGTTKYTKDELMEIFNDSVMGYAFCIKKKQPFSTNMVPFDSLFIDDLCVDQNIRGKHVGQKIFEHVKEEAKKMGCYEVTLNVWEGNDTARRFYEKMGMVPKETQMEFILK